MLDHFQKPFETDDKGRPLTPHHRFRVLFEILFNPAFPGDAFGNAGSGGHDCLRAKAEQPAHPRAANDNQPKLE